jgi:ribosomal 50S subunit-recycling heat shock protein
MAAAGRQRLDKWLFFTRVVKSRSLAAKLAVSGRVRINRDKASQASDLVKPGDVLTITLERRILVWKVLDTGTRPGTRSPNPLRGLVSGPVTGGNSGCAGSPAGGGKRSSHQEGTPYHEPAAGAGITCWSENHRRKTIPPGALWRMRFGLKARCKGVTSPLDDATRNWHVRDARSLV